ncbi:MAG: peptide deformylase [Verrucomicrobia bacterium]|nr:peptide deformylase [Verrucomicrobiota bacterium]
MILQLCYYDDPILRQKCKPIGEITEEIRQLARDMIETMDAHNGAGLAAPQVGQSVRLFVLRDYSDDGEWTQLEPKVFINPKLSKPGSHLLIESEGCLSIPGIRAPVERPDSIHIEALDLDGNSFTEEVHGYNARIRMHENDHLNGVLFIDRLDIHHKREIEPDLRILRETRRN